MFLNFPDHQTLSFLSIKMTDHRPSSFVRGVNLPTKVPAAKKFIYGIEEARRGRGSAQRTRVAWRRMPRCRRSETSGRSPRRPSRERRGRAMSAYDRADLVAELSTCSCCGADVSAIMIHLESSVSETPHTIRLQTAGHLSTPETEPGDTNHVRPGTQR